MASYLVPCAVAVLCAGFVYASEIWGHRVLALDLRTNQLSVLAGTGEAGFSGDGGLALDAKFQEPTVSCPEKLCAAFH